MTKVLYKGPDSRFTGLLSFVVAGPEQGAKVEELIRQYDILLYDVGPRRVDVQIVNETMKILNNDKPYVLYTVMTTLVADNNVSRVDTYTENLAYTIGHRNPFGTSALNSYMPEDCEFISFMVFNDYGSYYYQYHHSDAGIYYAIKEWMTDCNNYLGKIKTTPVIATHTNNAGVKYLCDRNMGMAYGGRPYEIEVVMHDNLCDAINYPGHFSKGYMLTPELNVWAREYLMGKTQMRAEFIDNTLVVSDNTTAIDSLRETLKNSVKIIPEYNIVAVNQFTLTHSNTYGILMPHTTNTRAKVRYLRLTIVNKDKIKNYRQDRYLNAGEPYLSGTVVYQKTKYKTFNLTFKSFPLEPHKPSHYIIGYVPNADDHIKAVEYIDKMMGKFPAEAYEWLMLYPTKFLMTVAEDEDVLVKWFNMATSNAQSEEDKLKKAYEQLKNNLVREYKEVELYLANNNIANKKPVPAVRIEDTLARSGTKKMAFELLPYRLNTVGYRELRKPISYKSMNINFLLPIKRDNTPILWRGRCLVENLYDKKTNTLNITYESIRKGVDEQC